MLDAVHGSWEFYLPTEHSSPVEHDAFLKVTYQGDTVQFYYKSIMREEVGPMGHYENSTFAMMTEEWDGSFSCRSAMINCLIAFIPRTDEYPAESPIGWHAIKKIDLPDDKLNELLSVCFR